MKTTICLLLCALVATTYAAPAQMKTNQAEAQFIGGLFKLPNIIHGLTDGNEVDLQDDDDDFATIETLLSQRLQGTAEIEGIRNLFRKARKLARKVIPTVLKTVPKVIGALGGGGDSPGDGCNDVNTNPVNNMPSDVDSDLETVLSRVQSANDEAQANALLQSMLHKK